MKTREQVFAHLENECYNDLAIVKIMGFLIGNGVKSLDETVRVKIVGEGNGLGFEDFFDWWSRDEGEQESQEACGQCANCVLCGIMNDIAHKMETTEDLNMKSYYADQLSFLIESFGLDDDESCDTVVQ